MARRKGGFSDKTVRILGDRAGWLCSNPDCRVSTKGPHTDGDRSVNVGVGSHINAAEPGGPRYDPQQSEADRKSITNGIFLCQTCAKLIDSDEQKYTAALLRKWKADAEYETEVHIGKVRRAAIEPRLHLLLRPRVVRQPHATTILIQFWLANTGRGAARRAVVQIANPPAELAYEGLNMNVVPSVAYFARLDHSADGIRRLTIEAMPDTLLQPGTDFAVYGASLDLRKAPSMGTVDLRFDVTLFAQDTAPVRASGVLSFNHISAYDHEVEEASLTLPARGGE